MIKTSLVFLIIALLSLTQADISITTRDPAGEIQRLFLAFLTPDFFSLPELGLALLNTVSFALLGITLAIFIGILFSLFFAYWPIRLFCTFLRSIHEIFWAFIFMPLVGLNSLCGILAIAVPYSGIFAKVYTEIHQESDQTPSQALPSATSHLVAFFFTTLPIIFKDIKNYTAYRFECALRSSTILGFIGLPTFGYHLETAFREGMYSEAAALLYCFFILILSLRIWANIKFIVIPLIAALFLTSWEVNLSISNISRFFSYDIIPWPMRAEHYYTGNQILTFPLAETCKWVVDILTSLAIPGAWNTLLLSLIGLVTTACFALICFPLATNTFFSDRVRWLGDLYLVILRTIPEFILAYVFLQLFGPSMLPAIIALCLHNGAILAHLTGKNVDAMELPFDKPQKRCNLYFFEVLPRTYGQFLAFLFYRWEVIIRESAILGILGITTLGYYIDSSIALDHLDTALLLIFISAAVNMTIDTLSQIIRKNLRISGHVVTSSPPENSGTIPPPTQIFSKYRCRL